MSLGLILLRAKLAHRGRGRAQHYASKIAVEYGQRLSYARKRGIRRVSLTEKDYEKPAMRAVFAHDHIFQVSGSGGVYSHGFPSTAWDRYFAAFDQLTVVGRMAETARDGVEARVGSAERENVNFRFVPSLSSLRGVLIDRPRALRAIREELNQSHALIARVPSEIGAAAVSVARDLGLPYALEVVGEAGETLRNYGNLIGRVYAPIADLRLRSLAADARFALYVTRRALQQKYPTQGVQTGCSNVNLPDFDVQEIIGRRLARFEDCRFPLVMGTIGSLYPVKGIDVALEALANVRDRIPPFVYRVLGGGDSTKCRRRAEVLGISELVDFDGTLPAGEPVYRWLDQVDLYLQPSRIEGLPRTLVEAMSRGCPALGSRLNGIAELLPDDRTHPSGDAEALGDLIAGLATDPTAMRHDARRNTQVAVGYSRSVLAERRSAFWREFAEYARRAGAS